MLHGASSSVKYQPGISDNLSAYRGYASRHPGADTLAETERTYGGWHTRLYLDVCCLNRPFDDQGQPRIHLETEAVLAIIARIDDGEWEWLSSEVVEFEINRTPDRGRRTRVRRLAARAAIIVPVDAAVRARGERLAAVGFGAVDALHVACAEAGGADVLLTTDRQLLNVAARTADAISIRVVNPLPWIQETTR